VCHRRVYSKEKVQANVSALHCGIQGRGGVALLILNLCISPFLGRFIRGKTPRCTLCGWLGGPQNTSGHCGEDINLLSQWIF